MADLTVWPTDGAADGSVSSEARWRKMARMWVPSGVRLAGDLAPALVAGPAIQTAPGGCWLDGHYAELAAQATIAASANGLLVVRFTPADNHAELLYRDAATVPTQTDPTWELPIASMAAGAIADRRMRSGSPPRYPNYATLKLNRPTPDDGEQAVCLDDGRTYTFRSAAFVYPSTVSVPANRWEVVVNTMWPMSTDAAGQQTVNASSFGLDGFFSIQGHAGWDATSPPTMLGFPRFLSVTQFQYRVLTASNLTGTGTVGSRASSTAPVMYLSIAGYRV